MTTRDEEVQLRVRMRQSLRDALDGAARTSLNAEIVRRLQASFQYEQRIAEETERNKALQGVLLRFADAMERVLDEVTAATIREMRETIRSARLASQADDLFRAAAEDTVEELRQKNLRLFRAAEEELFRAAEEEMQHEPRRDEVGR